MNADGSLADGGADLVLGDLLAHQVQLHDLVILIRDGFQELFPVFLGKIHQILRDLLLAHILAKLIIEDIGLHFDQVNDALELSFRADGQLNRNRVTFEPIVHHVENIEEIGAHDVHLVHIDHARYIVFVGLAPNRLGLGLHAALGAQHGHRTVEHAQGALHLNGEVHVTRRVDNVDTAVAPEAGGGSRRDGDAAFLFLLHPVHDRVALMGLTQLVGAAGIEEHTFGRGGLTGVDVRHNTDISCILKRTISRHFVTPFRLPTEMGECLVGLCHLVGILALLHGGAGIVAGIHDLAGEAFLHGLFTALAGIGRQPAKAEGLTTLGTNLQRNLVGSAADTTGLDFQGRHDVFHRLLEGVETVFAGLLFDDFKCAIDDSLGNALLAVEHDAVNELSYQSGFVDRIRKDLSLGNITSSGHFASLLHKMIS